MPEISVKTRARDHEYTVLVEAFPGADLPAEIEKRVGTGDFVAVVDARVGALHRLREVFGSRPEWRHLEIGAGEASKTAAEFIALCDRLLSLGIDRRTVIVAVGGGVTGDMAGFAAATLLRGLRLVQVPTTLLAQVDSSVGGKTGINLAGGKNMVGAFHQPELVVADPAFLATLPEREYRAGLAEVVKYGVLGDREFFFQLLESTSPLVRRDPVFLAEVVARCCRMKADIVAEDERESGRRRLLNLGHTFGHALESLAEYDGTLLHGEAVSIGIAMATAYAEERGMLPGNEAQRIADSHRRLGLARRLADLRGGDPARDTKIAALSDALESDRLSSALGRDKKASRNSLTLVLPRAIGICEVVMGEAPKLVADFIRHYEKSGVWP